ncbi:hypothetical protein ACFOX2_10225 [Corynebacterium marambiense]|uniref:hypothetical protein n=1 Tax=Corynebacterium marambiense TaxID=2765364 RepID=UPI0036192207
MLILVPAGSQLGYMDAYRSWTITLVEDIGDTDSDQIGRWIGVDDLTKRIVVWGTLGTR